MRRATQAWIVTADDGLDAIQHSPVEALAVHEVLGDLQYAAIHGEIVVAGGDDQIRPADQTLLVDLVVMEECAAGRFATPTPSRHSVPATARTCVERISGSVSSCSSRSTQYRISIRRAW